MALIKCPECGKEVSDKALACIHCGFPLHENNTNNFCPYCGKSNVINAVFCGYCGENISTPTISNTSEITKTEIPTTEVDIMTYADIPNKMLKLQQAQLIQQQELNERQLEEQRRQYDAQAKCPICGSTSLTTSKQGFSVGKAVAGTMLFGNTGMLMGAMGANKMTVTCLKCGHKFNL